MTLPDSGGVFSPDLELPADRSTIRSWLRHNMPQQIWRDNTATAIAQALRNRGLGINNADFLGIRRQVINEAQFSGDIKDIGLDEFVPKALWNTEHGIKLSTNLQYRFTVTGQNFTTGEMETRGFSLGSDKEITLQSAIDTLRGLLGGEAEFYGINIEEIAFEYVLATQEFKGGR